MRVVFSVFFQKRAADVALLSRYNVSVWVCCISLLIFRGLRLRIFRNEVLCSCFLRKAAAFR